MASSMLSRMGLGLLVASLHAQAAVSLHTTVQNGTVRTRGRHSVWIEFNNFEEG